VNAASQLYALLAVNNLYS